MADRCSRWSGRASRRRWTPGSRQPTITTARRRRGRAGFSSPSADGRRCSTAVAYLHPAVERGNVEVLTDALATRIVFEGGRAVGVEVLRNNALETVRAEREVIVCAGRLPLAAPAAAVGHRARRRAAGPGHRAASRPAGRQEPPGPPDGRPRLADRPGEPAHRDDAREPGAVRARGARTADVRLLARAAPSSARARTSTPPTSSFTSAAGRRPGRPRTRRSRTTASPSSPRCSRRPAAGR